MNRKIVNAIPLGSFALLVVLGTAWLAQAQDTHRRYLSIPPLEQYLMERNAELLLGFRIGAVGRRDFPVLPVQGQRGLRRLKS